MAYGGINAENSCLSLLGLGQPAPDFSGKDQEDREISLKELIGRGRVVLYFYPKDFTRVCTTQACLFRDAHKDWPETSVVGVSVDSSVTHKEFAHSYGLDFPLLSDVDRSISKAYGVLRLFGVFTKRVTFVIDRDGILRGIFRHELSAGKHVDDVAALLAKLP